MSNCKYKTVRTKNYHKYLYCRNPNIKDIITNENCTDCQYKDYKTQKPISDKKKPRTIALSISTKVKQKVWERDKHKCINCHKQVTVDNACCHYIARSQGGLRHRAKHTYFM